VQSDLSDSSRAEGPGAGADCVEGREIHVSDRETRGGERPVQQGTPSQRTFRTTSCGRSGLYLQFRNTAMVDKCRIARDGSDFIVNHMLTTARSLVNAAVEAHRRLH